MNSLCCNRFPSISWAIWVALLLSLAYSLPGLVFAKNPAILALVTDSQATHFAVRDGNWTIATTWQNGILPNENARVVIPAQVSVTVDTHLEPNLKTIRVDGVLRFATGEDTRLKVDTLVVSASGHLEIGTAQNPIDSSRTAEILFVDDGPIDRDWDPGQFSRGLLVLGSAEMVGADVVDFQSLAVHPGAGTSALELSEIPFGWRIGDEIIITGSQGVQSDEVRVIASLNGVNVGLNQPLHLDHIPPRNDLNIYVANTTRNVRLASENMEVLRRGHIMMVHTLDVTMRNVGMYDLGRTDKSIPLDDLDFEFFDAPENNGGAPTEYEVFEGPANNIRGRYALHFHRGGFTAPTPALVDGCVVHGSPGWGFVNHTGHVEFRSNVAYGVQGSAYYTETGDEIGLFDGNIAIHCFNPRDPVNDDDGAIDPDLGHEQQEFGNSGDGFWLSGHRVSVTNNVVSGASGHGIIIWSDGVCEADRPRTSIPVAALANGHLISGQDEVANWWAPLATISGNECTNATIGFRTRYIHSQTYLGIGGSSYHKRPSQAYIDTLKPTVENLLVWGCRDGVLMNYSERMRLKDSDIIGIGAPFVLNGGTANTGVGVDFGTENTRGPGRIENVNIEGFQVGVVAPRNDTWALDNLTLRNTVDVLIQEPRTAPRALTMNNLTFGSLAGTAVASQAGQRQNIQMRPDFFPSYQPFFFVLPDRITLDGQGIYFDEQAPDFVPYFKETDEEEQLLEVPEAYFGATNQELQTMFGVSFGGNLIPAGSSSSDKVDAGVVGPALDAPTNLPLLLDMTNEGFDPEPFPGGPEPELTGLSLHVCRGQAVTMLNSNFNATDTNTEIGDLIFTVESMNHGWFDHRLNPGVPVFSFTQAEINGGVIRFTHDGGSEAPSFDARVSDGTTTTAPRSANVSFCDLGGGKILLGDVNLDGTVNLLDVEPFISRVGSGMYQAEADINADGAVNLLDVGPFVTILSGG